MKNDKVSQNAEPCYTIADIAKVLEIDEEEAKDIISQKEKTHDVRFMLDEDETMKKH